MYLLLRIAILLSMLNFQGVLGPQNALVLKSFRILYLGIIQKEATSIFGELPLMVQKTAETHQLIWQIA